MAEVGSLLYDIAMAYATAWAFQFLVITLPEQQRQRAFERIIAPRVDSLAQMGLEMANVIGRSGPEGNGRFPLPPEEVAYVLAKIAPAHEAPGWALTWLPLVEHLSEKGGQARAALRPFYPRMSEELLVLLEAEERAANLIGNNVRIIRHFGLKDLSRLTDPVTAWLATVQDLREHRRTALAPGLPVPEPEKDSDSIRAPLDSLPTLLPSLETGSESGMNAP